MTTVPVRSVMISFGYVESQENSDLVVTQGEDSEGFETPQEALADFVTACATVLGKMRQYSYSNPPRRCPTEGCRGHQASFYVKFCPDCGQPTQVVGMDTEELLGFIRELAGTMDGIGEAWQDLQEMGWTLGSVCNGGVAAITAFDRVLREKDPHCAILSTFVVSDHTEVDPPAESWMGTVLAKIPGFQR